MKAKIQPKFNSSQRLDLKDILPRNTPFSLEIDVASTCNLQCNFCFHGDPQGIRNSKVPLGLMKMSLFEKIISDISGFRQPPNKLKLFEFGEPLLNNNIARMIQLAKTAFPNLFIEITTNAILLNPTLTNELISAGLDRINISVESTTSKGYKDICGVAIDYSEFINNISYLYHNKRKCHVYIKMIDTGKLSELDRELFFKTFSTCCDEIFIENVSSIWKDTNADACQHKTLGAYNHILTSKLVCPFIFTRMVVNFDGIVSLCCADWQRKMIIGNANNESLVSIWNGTRLRNIQITHLQGNRHHIPLCNGCTTLCSSTLDNIDDYRTHILTKMEQGKYE